MTTRKISFDKPASSPAPVQTVTPSIVPMQPSVTPNTAVALATTPVSPPVTVTPPSKRLTLDEVDRYGATATQAVARVSDDLLKVARAGDMDVIGKDLGDLLVAAQKYDPANLGKGGLFSWGKATIQRMRNNFDTVHGLVGQLASKADGNIALFEKRIGELKVLYEGTKKYYYDLEQEIARLDAQIAAEEAYPPETDPNDPFQANEFQKWQTTISFAKKRAQELRLQQTLAQQNAQTITMMAVNAGALVRKFKEVMTFTIPNLKMSFNLAIQNIEQAKAVDFADSVDALNNKTIIENAKRLGQNTTKIQTSLTRNSVELSTLQFNQEAIINSMNEVKRIHQEMADRITAERPQIEAMQKQLATLQTTR